MRSAVIIPDYNEGERVIAVANAALDSRANEVIVVNDGSTDNTAEILGGIENITVLSHETNLGKGEAMDTGVQHAMRLGAAATVFLDADLRGLRPDHVDSLLDPLETDSYMSIGYLGLRIAVMKKRILNQWGMLSGQRAIRTDVWELLSDRDKHRFNIEVALNARLRHAEPHRSIARVGLDGVGHVSKPDKEGNYPKALWGYSKTYGAAVATYARIELECLTTDDILG